MCVIKGKKTQPIDVLMVFINEIERQLDRKVKISQGLIKVVSIMENMMRRDNVLVHLLNF